jgi:hypothetical protein
MIGLVGQNLHIVIRTIIYVLRKRDGWLNLLNRHKKYVRNKNKLIDMKTTMSEIHQVL